MYGKKIIGVVWFLNYGQHPILVGNNQDHESMVCFEGLCSLSAKTHKLGYVKVWMCREF